MKKIDLIIPTYNRTKFLDRILDYYQNYGRYFNFIIADSSNDNNKAINKKTISEYSKLNILHLNHFPQTMPQHQKFIEMVKFIKSEYCVFCADDDFVIPEGIIKCIDFLEKNPDYSVAHGTYISFYLQKNFLGTMFFNWRILFSPKTLSESKPINRVSAHLSDFVLSLWAVRRSKDVKLAYEEFSKVQFNSYTLPNFGELLPDALIAAFGKIKFLNTFYGARQCFSQINSTYLSLMDANNINKYATEYEKFKKVLSLNIVKSSSDSIEKIQKQLDYTMDSYFKYSYQEHLQNKIYRTLEKYSKFISRWLKTLHTNYLFSKKNRGQLGLIDHLVSPYYKEFMHIKECVLKHGDI